MAGKAVAIDPGSHTTKVLVARSGKHGISVVRFGAVPAAEGAAGLRELGVPLQNTVAGLAGRDMTLRYTQAPPVADWQLQNLMELEIADLKAQSGGELSADYNLLPIEDEEGGMETVLVALARDEALDRVSAVVREAGGSVTAHVPNCIAIYNAYLRCGQIDEEATVALVSLGHETIDLAIVRGMDLLFARNLSGGGKVLDEAIVAAFDVSARKAESLKKELLDLDPASRGRFASGQAEKVTMAAGGAAGVIVAAIQSSLAFCKSQTKIKDLRLDRVLVCGGSASLRGLRGYLREALRVPVEPFDPFQNVDLSELPEADRTELDAHRGGAVAALGLAVGRLDRELYSLEILPEAVRRKQRFLQRTVWSIAAGVVAVLLLVALALRAKERQESATVAARSIEQQRARIASVDRATRELLEQNAQTRAVVQELGERALPLHSLLMTMRVLNETLPPEAWVQTLQLRTSTSRGGRDAGRSDPRDPHPVVEVDGFLKPVTGRSTGDVYQGFNRDFRSHGLIPKDGFQAVPGGTDEKKAFKFTIDFVPPAPTPDTEPK